MFDISFYMSMRRFQKLVDDGAKLSKESIQEAFDNYRNSKPYVYNIETTNACNMKCKMCPRTTMMTRPIETIKPEMFQKIINQLTPHTNEKWDEWKNFVEAEYGIQERDMGENHFFLYIIPKVIQLHGYGDPLLDKNMFLYVRLLADMGFYSYFSCNPANIDIEKTVEMFENGLDYIKYSIESVDDDSHKKIRGNASNFQESYEKILHLLDLKKKWKYKTTIIITMLDLNRENQAHEFEQLRKAFKGLDVYIYLKSEDQQWYRKDPHGTNSVHWSEFCKHPWMSMTVKSNGDVAMCMEDFNNEIVLGNVETESLYDIWNGEKYMKFRENHFSLDSGIKCTDKCDMHLVGEYI